MLEENKAVVRKFIEALGKGDAEALDDSISEDIQAICIGSSRLSGTRGHADVLGAAGMLGQLTKSGIDFRILHLTAEGDRVSAEVEGASTLVTGVPYNNQYHFLFFLREGRIFRIKEYLDTQLMDQLLVPFLPKPA